MKITVQTQVRGDLKKVWNAWTDPKHIIHWNNASPDWCTPKAEVDLKNGGTFTYRMEAVDGSIGFDFQGTFTKVEPHSLIFYKMADGREASITFADKGDGVEIVEVFDAENVNPHEMQQAGWQAILDNFKKYVEHYAKFETLQYEISISSPADKVYQTMLFSPTYEQWVAVFNPTSHYQGSWDKGSRILFLGEDTQGQVGGMVSRIAEHIPAQYVSIEHLGFFQQGKEILEGPEVESWKGCLENYRFISKGPETKLKVQLHSTPEMKEYFNEHYPQALEKLKNICESN